MSDGETLDSEKAARREFRDLLDDPASTGFIGSDLKVAIVCDKLCLVRELVSGRSDVTFAFLKMVDGRDYPRLPRLMMSRSFIELTAQTPLSPGSMS